MDKHGTYVDYNLPLGTLEEVSLNNLAYDLEDARRFKVGGSGWSTSQGAVSVRRIPRSGRSGGWAGRAGGLHSHF